ncbi:MAG: hypothetical protein JSS20_15115 [Proteobacteria bacterium]|nr:hypothetical protein [Pseudomonadota bacterium]
MPNDVKGVLSVITLIVGYLVARWEGSVGHGGLYWLVIGFAVFAVFAMWVFPEAKATKKDLAGKK